jgi:hypothetical protein
LESNKKSQSQKDKKQDQIYPKSQFHYFNSLLSKEYAKDTTTEIINTLTQSSERVIVAISL